MSKTLPRRCWIIFDGIWECCSLHAWSIDYVEGSGGYGQYPVGIIERGGGRSCESIDVNKIHLREPEDWNK